MDRQYRTYSEAFKLEALELKRTTGKSSAQIECDLGITKGLLLKWRDHPLTELAQRRADSQGSYPCVGPSTPVRIRLRVGYNQPTMLAIAIE